MIARSLVGRLTALALAAVAAVWVASAVFAVARVRHETGELLDAHLVQAAAILHSRLGDDVDDAELEHAPELHRYARGLAFQVWERGTLRLHSANAPDTPLAPSTAGFDDVTRDGRSWRVFSSLDRRGRVLVQVAEERRARDRIVTALVGALAWPLVVGLPVLALLVALALRSGLRPLAALGGEVARRDPGNLAALVVADPPVEVAPLVDALNGLFERLRCSIERERGFTADAAHELRTPIAALRAQAEVALAASAATERERALRSILAGCDRAARLVDQMLTLARLDALAAPSQGATLDLAAVARDAVAELAPGALARGVEVALDATPSRVDGDAALVAVLIRNLVDNAVRHGPDGSAVDVLVRADAAGVELVVTDRGPGVPIEGRARLGERFHRPPGTGAGGSGLGLSIVKRIAELHGARLVFESPPTGTGFVVRVRFPAAGGAHASTGR